MHGDAHNPTTLPVDDGPGNGALHAMRDKLAEVTAAERQRRRG